MAKKLSLDEYQKLGDYLGFRIEEEISSCGDHSRIFSGFRGDSKRSIRFGAIDGCMAYNLCVKAEKKASDILHGTVGLVNVVHFHDFRISGVSDNIFALERLWVDGTPLQEPVLNDEQFERFRAVILSGHYHGVAGLAMSTNDVVITSERNPVLVDLSATRFSGSPNYEGFVEQDLRTIEEYYRKTIKE